MVRKALYPVRHGWCVVVMLLILMASGMVWLLRNHVNGDIAWYLYAAKRFSQGAVLYRDVKDTNPPLIYFVHLPFIYLARFSGLALHTVFFAGLWLFLCAALWISFRLLRAIGIFSRPWCYVIVLFSAYEFGIAARIDFGQRDHMAAMAFLPFVLLIAARIRGTLPARSWVFGIAAAAGLALALKPYFLLPWMLVLAYLAWKRGIPETLRSPECWLVLVINALYWLLTWIFIPQFFPVGAAIAKYYSALDAGLSAFAPLLPLCAILCIVPTLKFRPAMRPLLILSFLASCGFVLEALAQRKGWSYHLVPAACFIKITLLLAIAGFLQMPRSYRSAVYWKPHLAALVTCILILAGSIRAATQVAANPDIDSLRTLILQYANGTPVLVFSSDLWDSFPLLYEAEAQSATSEPCAWTLPALYRDQIAAAKSSPAYARVRYHAANERTADEQRLFAAIRQAITEKHPNVIIVQDRNPKNNLGRLDFDFVQYFGTDRDIHEALQQYRAAGRVECCRVLVRQ